MQIGLHDPIQKGSRSGQQGPIKRQSSALRGDSSRRTVCTSRARLNMTNVIRIHAECNLRELPESL